MDKWHSIAEEKIKEAMQEGAFRNLQGQGRPLKLERNPFEPAELRMAHMVLEGAGMSPAWIQERKELDGEIDRACAALTRAAADRWDQAEAGFRAAAKALNSRILTYNLSVPAGGFQRPQIDVEFELRRARQVSS